MKKTFIVSLLIIGTVFTSLFSDDVKTSNTNPNAYDAALQTQIEKEKNSDNVSVINSAEKLVSLKDVTDKRVIDFIERYTEGFSIEEYVSQVDTLEGIYIVYNSELEIYKTYFEYPDMDEAVVYFYPYELIMLYSTDVKIPSLMRINALNLVNEYNSYIDRNILGTVFLPESGYICLKHNVLDDGVSDYGEWAYWNFYTFDSFAYNVSSDILEELELI